MTIRGSASSFEFRKRLGKERTKQVFRKQAERELAVRQNAVGIELSFESLQVAVECLASTDRVTVQFLVDCPKLLVSQASSLAIGIGGVEPVLVLMIDQCCFAFDEF